MVRLGFKRALRLEDLWPLEDENTSDDIIRKFQPNYEAETARATKGKNSSSFNVLFPLVKTFGGEFLPLTAYRLIDISCTFAFPLVLDRLITFIKSDGEETCYLALSYLSMNEIQEQNHENKTRIGGRINR